MHIVSDGPDPDQPRRDALAAVRRALRELTANLLRMIRGAGKPYLIVGQLDELTTALIAYSEKSGSMMPSDHDLKRALTPEEYDPLFRATYGDLEAERRDAIQQIVRGSLQLVASQMLGQSTQEAAGRSEMHAGSRALGEINKQQLLAQQRGSRKPPDLW
jgi:hypothetical protein